MRRIIGYVPQMLSADGTLTGYENLLVFAKLYGSSGASGRSASRRRSSSWDWTTRPTSSVRQYSGGMIRRLEIAQSMLHGPARPVPGRADGRPGPLRPQRRLGAHRGAARPLGTTIVLTTHQMEEADSCATGSPSCTRARSSPWLAARS